MFNVDLTADTFELRYPTGTWPAARLHAAADQLTPLARLEHSPVEGPTQTLRLRAPTLTLNGAVNQFFCYLNEYPYHDPDLTATFRDDPQPLVSCIVLLPFNDVFVHNVLLPSIIHNSQGHAIEIILVQAGVGVNAKRLGHLRRVDSEFGCIAKGYNAGVRAARGKYVALFHDDCLLDDPRWIDTCLAGLRGEVRAVAAEADTYGPLRYGKAVPLFLERAFYLELGGYDEFYYVGVEDIDLACACRARGARMDTVAVRAFHLRGMGSSLIVHPQPRQLKLLFGFQVLPRAVIRRIHEDCMQALVAVPFIRALEAEYYLRLCQKYEAILATDGLDVAARVQFFQRRLYPYLLTPYGTYARNRPALLAAYQGLMNLPELSQCIEY